MKGTSDNLSMGSRDATRTFVTSRRHVLQHAKGANVTNASSFTHTSR
jgi:hypothetical protein